MEDQNQQLFGRKQAVYHPQATNSHSGCLPHSFGIRDTQNEKTAPFKEQASQETFSFSNSYSDSGDEFSNEMCLEGGEFGVGYQLDRDFNFSGLENEEKEVGCPKSQKMDELLGFLSEEDVDGLNNFRDVIGDSFEGSNSGSTLSDNHCIFDLSEGPVAAHSAHDCQLHPKTGTKIPSEHTNNTEKDLSRKTKRNQKICSEKQSKAAKTTKRGRKSPEPLISSKTITKRKRFRSAFSQSGRSYDTKAISQLRKLQSVMTGLRRSSPKTASSSHKSFKMCPVSLGQFDSLSSMIQTHFDKSRRLNCEAGQTWQKMQLDVQKLAVKAAERQLRLLKKSREYDDREETKKWLSL